MFTFFYIYIFKLLSIIPCCLEGPTPLKQIFLRSGLSPNMFLKHRLPKISLMTRHFLMIKNSSSRNKADKKDVYIKRQSINDKEK